MHKALLNTLELEFRIIPNGPILIKSGTEEGVNPTLPNMNFVRGINPNWQNSETIYLPGSSLKGVIRSHFERIIRTTLSETHCCDPLSKDACGEKDIFKTNVRRATPQSGADVYRQVCLACRTFGHTVVASRFVVADAYPQPINGLTLDDVQTLPIRQMVAIDRRSGGSVNTFTMEVATQGEFTTRIFMRNFERWQVGLLSLVLRDLGLGRVGIGFGKSRGLGQVKIQLDRLSVIYPGSAPEDCADRIYGVGDLLHLRQDEAAIRNYGFDVDHDLQTDFPGVRVDGGEWGQPEIHLTETDSIVAAFQSLSRSWGRFVARSA